jgi:hypothetical protein
MNQWLSRIISWKNQRLKTLWDYPFKAILSRIFPKLTRGYTSSAIRIRINIDIIAH